MIGEPTSAYYSQIWYDWARGMQISSFVWPDPPDTSGAYVRRMDQWLPKKKAGPRVYYSWDKHTSKWFPACYTKPDAHSVGMPVPNFVKAGRGACRAIIDKSSHFGTISIWSAALPAHDGFAAADFWFWFNERNEGVIFSLAPASSLTLIDYQTFVRNAGIDACIFDDPTPEIEVCGQQHMVLIKERPRFVPALHEPG
jgi:hypothetical protein